MLSLFRAELPIDTLALVSSKARGLFLGLGSTLFTLGIPAAIVAVILWASGDMRDVAHRFLGHVRKREDEQAYALTTRNMQQTIPSLGWASYVDVTIPHV